MIDSTAACQICQLLTHCLLSTTSLRLSICLSVCLSVCMCICLYVCLCTGNGLDVVHIKVSARQILWPPLAQSVVSDIIKFITSPAHHRQPILVHGFSVGGYLYGETLNHIISDAQLTQSFSQRIRGQVFDSPVDFEGVPHGVGMALSDVRPVQVAIKSSLNAYTSLFHRQVTSHYHQSSQTFRQNPLRTPSLLLYSKADVVGTPGPIESLIATWRSVGVPVSCRCWEKSRHVEHYLRDPVNYILELKQFLVSVGLLHHDDDGEEEHRRSMTMPASKL